MLLTDPQALVIIAWFAHMAVMVGVLCWHYWGDEP